MDEFYLEFVFFCLVLGVLLEREALLLLGFLVVLDLLVALDLVVLGLVIGLWLCSYCSWYSLAPLRKMSEIFLIP